MSNQPGLNISRPFLECGVGADALKCLVYRTASFNADSFCCGDPQ